MGRGRCLCPPEVQIDMCPVHGNPSVGKQMNDKINIPMDRDEVKALVSVLTRFLDMIPEATEQDERGMIDDGNPRVIPGSVTFRTLCPVDIMVTGGQVQRYVVRADIFDLGLVLDGDDELEASLGPVFLEDEASSVIEDSDEEKTLQYAAMLEGQTGNLNKKPAPWLVEKEKVKMVMKR